METSNSKSSRQLSLWQTLDEPFLKLPFAVMRDVGPAVQTLGALLQLTQKATFAGVGEIACRAYLPVPTVRKHLRRLVARGWIQSRGRERGRRTCTLVVPESTREAVTPFGVLPWWAAQVRPWAARAVFSVVMGQLLRLRGVVIRECVERNPEGFKRNHGLWWEALELVAPWAFGWSVSQLERLTGLSRRSVIQARRRLRELELVDSPFDGRQPLWPNRNFRVLIITEPDGSIRVRRRIVDQGHPHT